MLLRLLPSALWWLHIHVMYSSLCVRLFIYLFFTLDKDLMKSDILSVHKVIWEMY